MAAQCTSCRQPQEQDSPTNRIDAIGRPSLLAPFASLVALDGAGSRWLSIYIRTNFKTRLPSILISFLDYLRTSLLIKNIHARALPQPTAVTHDNPHVQLAGH